jgi:putative oxidoreductase
MTQFERQANLAALALRLLLAVWFGYHFYYKCEAGFAANVNAFVARGLPGIFGYIDILVEIIVIPFLVLGIYSRFCIMALTPLMLGAVGVFWPRGFNFTFAGWELPALWLLVMWILGIIGDGRYAIRLPHLSLDGRHPATRWDRQGDKP